jgi:hypothetical protein
MMFRARYERSYGKTVLYEIYENYQTFKGAIVYVS